MKYTLANPTLDTQIVEIKRKIRLSMNGIVSGQMVQNGIIYKKNFGVSIPRIKEIASLYTPNHDLAQRLWDLQIRETMILATLLEPKASFDIRVASEMVGSFQQLEIAEQASMNLFSKVNESVVISKEWVQSKEEWIQITGFMVAARIYDLLTKADIEFIIQEALKATDTDNFHLYKAVGLCLSRFCRKDTETSAYILKEIEAISQTTSKGQSYISNEVKQEILFLNNL